MSSGGATTKGGPVKGVQAAPSNTINNNNKKSSKSDSKSDKLDLNPKIQATAEQMQIAKIIDTHRAEDPELQKKIRQVMEITRTTEDQACMALHSREYDIEQAITLLTDGGSQSLESEWAQAGKKRKSKTPNQNQKADVAIPKDPKAGVNGGDRAAGRDKSEKRDSKGEKKDLEGGDQPFIGEQRRGDRGSRGGRPDMRGGRGSRPGGPGAGRGGGFGGGRSDKENEELKSGRIANGPGRGGSRGGGGFGARGGRGGGRTFASRARGDREGGDSYNSIDVWENSQADGAREAPLKVDKWGEFPPAEDWDNEEYTGSLADTKVFTPSSQTAQGPLNDSTNGSGSNHIQSASNNSSADNKMSANQESGVTMSSVVQGLAGSSSINSNNVQAGQVLDLNMLLSKQNTGGSSAVAAHTNPGVNLLASLQSSYSNASQMSVGGSNQGLPPRNKVQRPRGPPSKIPSSAVEMPDQPTNTTLDVQFGGMDLSSDCSLSFSSVMQGGKPSSADNSMIYGVQGGKLDSSFGPGGDKDIKPTSSFQQQASINPQSQQQGSHNESGKGNNNVTSNMNPGIDTLNSITQNQTKSQSGPNSYGAAVNSGSAFVSYGVNKSAPNFPAPGFPPVSQAAGTYNSSNIAPVTGGVPPAYISQQPLPNQQQQSGYMGNLPYGHHPSNLPPSQTIVASQSANVPYGNPAAPASAYHMNSNSGYSNSAATQYNSYGQKMGGLNSATNVKDSSTDSANVPVSTGSSAASAQIGTNIQPGSGEDWNYGTELPSTASSTSKLSAPANTTATNATSKVGSTMPPGIMMPQYILSQNAATVPFYGVQTPMYGYEDNSMQFVPRFDPNLGGYYAPGGPQSYVVPQVSGRNDVSTIQAYSTGTDGRFQRSDNSSTASPVPSNLAGGNTQQQQQQQQQQQTMYNPQAMPYFYVANNMGHGSHYPYAPPMYPTQMATAGANSGAQHAAATNHQYQQQGKGVYNSTQYTYDTSQGGQSSDSYGKTYGGGSGGVGGPNSNSGKVATGSATGSSQSTDLSSPMYGKGHNMNKMNSYEKQYGVSSGGYNSMGAQPNVLGSQQISGTGMGPPYGVYIQQAVQQQTLPMHQDGNNASRQGQPKGKQQQYGGGPPYWQN